MARFAHALPLLQSHCHQFGKLCLVRVLVAGFARAITKVISPVGSRGRIFLPVAILASDGGVRALQRE
jgi:hypothetical protein